MRVGPGLMVGLALLVVVFVPLAIIGQFALREIVVRREGVFASVRGGYGVFRRNIGRSLLVWLINLGLTIGVAIVFLIGLLLVGLVRGALRLARGILHQVRRGMPPLAPGPACPPLRRRTSGRGRP